MYASDMQQWNKVPLIGFGVAGNQGSFIIRRRNGAIEQASQATERNVYRNQSKLAKEASVASKLPLFQSKHWVIYPRAVAAAVEPGMCRVIADR
jgi:hypothetical protein